MFSEEVTGKKYSTYSNFAICIPFGFGIKKAFHSTAGIKLEASYRFTNTDYLDDVSTFYYDRDKLRDEMKYMLVHELAQMGIYNVWNSNWCIMDMLVTLPNGSRRYPNYPQGRSQHLILMELIHIGHLTILSQAKRGGPLQRQLYVSKFFSL